MQIAGRRCGHCSERVLMARDAQGCPACDIVFHLECLADLAPRDYRTDRGQPVTSCPHCRQAFSRTLAAEEQRSDAEARDLVALGQRRTRQALLAFVAPMLALDAAYLADASTRGGLPMVFARLVAAVALAMGLRTGRRWAHVATVVWSAALAIVSVVRMIASLPDVPFAILHAAASVAYGYAALSLASSRAVRSYLQEQEIARTGRTSQ